MIVEVGWCQPLQYKRGFVWNLLGVEQVLDLPLDHDDDNDDDDDGDYDGDDDHDDHHDDDMMMILQMLRICMRGFPNRMPYPEFIYRF